MSCIVIFTVNYFFKNNNNYQTSKNIPTIKKNITTIDDTLIDLIIQEDDIETTLSKHKRINFENSSISGSIRLQGSRIDDLYLKKYKETIEENSKNIELLKPANTKDQYFTDLGWLSLDNNIQLPSAETVWTTNSDNLTAENPILLTWENEQGVIFNRNISIDDSYLFTITDTVYNNSNNNIEIFPYALMSRRVEQDSKMRSVVHEGITAVINDSLEEYKYKDIDKNDKETFEASKGWIGFSDRYWFNALILNDNEKSKVTFKNNNNNNFLVDYLGQRIIIPNNQSASYTYKLFSGAKEIKTLDKYVKENKFHKFDLAVDFGWYYFLTKPFFYILDFLYNFIGNMGWAILLFALILKLLMFPVANKSYTNMAKMKKLQPKIAAIKEKYGDNQLLIQKATMDLYKKDKVNPASGCLPMFIQIPVFFSLYKVLNIAIEIRQAPFIGWIKDLSAPDPLTLSQITNINLPNFIDIGIWPIFMGLTMWMQQKLNPTPVNKDQARMFALMPIFLTFMLGHFASGLVIYWSLSNIIAIVQQKVIMRRNGIK